MSQQFDTDYDVIVIGGGPAGSSSATFLAQSGKRVLLLEREKFPRYHIGESLLSGTLELFRKLGVLDQLEKTFTKKWGVEWIWGETRKKWTTYFKDAVSIPYDYGFQVERAEFDKILLDNAASHGVHVREECKVLSSITEGDRVVGVEFEALDGGEVRRALAKWVIDASGQGGLITRKTQKQQWDPLLQNMAVWSYWRNAKRGEGIDNGNTFLPTFSEGWWWFIPLRNEITSIGCVVDRKNMDKLKEQGIEEFYHAAIARTPELAERLEGAEQVEKIRILRDWSYEYDNFCGKGYLAAGDSACFIDPLFSTGVHLALLAGYMSSLVVNTLLEDETADEAALLAFYERNYRRDFTRYRDQVYFLYAGQASSQEDFFWKARSIFDRPNLDPRQAFISLIAGSFEHRGWYHRCLQRMGTPTELQRIVTELSDPEQFKDDTARSNLVLRVSDGWQVVDDYSIENDRLVPSKTIRTHQKLELPLTPVVDGILAEVRRGHGVDSIVATLTEDGKLASSNVYRSLADAITYGVLELADAPAGQQRAAV
ncbi:NAD(P)/FAD-dependent oxidoreductase [Mesorhizobium sp. INR15]|uniref:NAD(P)/FAD-dependent oxidoreductase n=1 Tax=Mesorhizobium sp. INR15 TaxID=2654248 RepID=UPI0018967CF3|nr:NAD(P)/FAD-dependent oxidoreductase [Mesorhizobium sp. INR15]QPC94579.1 FAD-dependent oxidoreductase [Mesorhizobium sp. INR15]